MSDPFRTPRPDPRDDEDAATRAAYGPMPWGRRMRRPFYQHLPEAPTGRVTRDACTVYVQQIDRVMEMQEWTSSEMDSLRLLRRRWARRAAGRDTRFNALGVQGGVTEKHRPKTVGDIVGTIYDAIDQSRGLLDGGRVVREETRYVSDPKWPMGKPVGRG